MESRLLQPARRVKRVELNRPAPLWSGGGLPAMGIVSESWRRGKPVPGASGRAGSGERGAAARPWGLRVLPEGPWRARRAQVVGPPPSAGCGHPGHAPGRARAHELSQAGAGRWHDRKTATSCEGRWEAEALAAPGEPEGEERFEAQRPRVARRPPDRRQDLDDAGSVRRRPPPGCLGLSRGWRPLRRRSAGFRW